MSNSRAKNVPVNADTIDVYSNLTVTDGKVQLKVYSLSPFGVVLPKDEDMDNNSEETVPKVTSEKVNSAKTGDTAPVFGLVLAVAAAAVLIIALVVVRVRRRRK